MNWQYVTWTAGAATVAALLITCLPVAAAAFGPARARSTPATGSTPAAGAGWAATRSGRAAPAVMCLLVMLLVAEVVFDGLVDPPAWVRAGWAVTTAVTAAWFAAHSRELAVAAGAEYARPAATPARGTRATMGDSPGPTPIERVGTHPSGVQGTMPTAPHVPAAPAWQGQLGHRQLGQGQLGHGQLAAAPMTDPLSEQDDLVQTLVVASYALQMGDEPRARQAVEGALRRSRATLDVLMRERGYHGLVRSEPATTAGRLAGR